jgi:hypothetical protein
MDRAFIVPYYHQSIDERLFYFACDCPAALPHTATQPHILSFVIALWPLYIWRCSGLTEIKQQLVNKCLLKAGKMLYIICALFVKDICKWLDASGKDPPPYPARKVVM